MNLSTPTSEIRFVAWKIINCILLFSFSGATGIGTFGQPSFTLEKSIQLEPHTSSVLHEKTNKVALVLPDQSIKIIDLTSDKIISRIPAQRMKNLPPEFSSDGEKLCTIQENQAVYWEVNSGKKLVEFPIAKSWDRPQWNDNCTRLLHAEKKVGVFYTKVTLTIKVWDAKTGYHQYTIVLPFRPEPDPEVRFSSDGERMLLTDRSYAELREAISGKSIAILFVDERWLRHDIAGRFSDDSKFISVMESDKTTLWEAVTGRKIVTLSLPDMPARNSFAIFTRDGKFVITTSTKGKYLWEIATGKLVRTIWKTDSSDVMYSARLSPDEQRLYVYVTTGVIRWRMSAYIEDLVTGNNRVSLTGDVGKQWLMRLVWEPQGTAFVVPLKNNPRTAEIWNADSATLRATIPFYYREEWGLYEPPIHTDEFRFNPQHPLLLAQNEKYFRIWDIRTGKLLQPFDSSMTTATWAGNGEKIVVISKDEKLLQIWCIDD